MHKDVRGTDLNLYPFDLTSCLLSTIFLVASSLTGEDMIEPPPVCIRVNCTVGLPDVQLEYEVHVFRYVVQETRLSDRNPYQGMSLLREVFPIRRERSKPHLSGPSVTE